MPFGVGLRLAVIDNRVVGLHDFPKRIEFSELNPSVLRKRVDLGCPSALQLNRTSRVSSAPYEGAKPTKRFVRDNSDAIDGRPGC